MSGWRLSRPLGGTLGAVAIVAFVAFVGSRAVNGVILNPDFYFDALDGGAIFESVFDSLLENPEDIAGDLLSLLEEDDAMDVPSTDEIGSGTLDALDAIDASLEEFNSVVDIFKVIEPIALVIFLVALGVMAASTFREPVRLLRWTGGTLAVAGGLTLALWFGLQGVVEEMVADVALDKAGDLPLNFQDITKMSVMTAIDNLSPDIFGPAVAAAALGIILLAMSFLPSVRGAEAGAVKAG